MTHPEHSFHLGDCPQCDDQSQSHDEILVNLLRAAQMAEDECAALRQAIEYCPECFERIEREKAVRDLVKQCCGQDTAPATLRTRIVAQLKVSRTVRMEGEGPR